jgi:hypothetical protein
VGDSDTTVGVQAGAVGIPAATNAMARLIERLTVAAATDDVKGEGGSNVVVDGNRAVAASPLVKSPSISSKSTTSAPVAPKINWDGRLGASGPPVASSSAWLENFLNGLARTGDNPNERIRIKL